MIQHLKRDTSSLYSNINLKLIIFTVFNFIMGLRTTEFCSYCVISFYFVLLLVSHFQSLDLFSLQPFSWSLLYLLSRMLCSSCNFAMFIINKVLAALNQPTKYTHLSDTSAKMSYKFACIGWNRLLCTTLWCRKITKPCSIRNTVWCMWKQVHGQANRQDRGRVIKNKRLSFQIHSFLNKSSKKSREIMVIALMVKSSSSCHRCHLPLLLLQWQKDVEQGAVQADNGN